MIRYNFIETKTILYNKLLVTAMDHKRAHAHSFHAINSWEKPRA